MLNRISHRLKQIKQIANGFLFKWKVDFFGIPKIDSSKSEKNTERKIIVSLTSYGRRVEKVVYYTIISLLIQSKKPDHIILWLDESVWNEDNLPTKLKRLFKYGVNIRFCKDLKSYTKLVPTLRYYPDDVIITVDDDGIYHKNVIEELYNEHLKYPSYIICNMAMFPKINKEGFFVPYKEWEGQDNSSQFIMPLGVSGVLYPPHSLFNDVSNDSLFLKLSPLADDLWFWLMGVLQGSKHKVINQNKSFADSFDVLYQYFHRYSALTHQNSGENKNDIQVKNILDHYKLSARDIQPKIQ